jgi:predicted enzyme related to lactoylglutathione lyase
MPRAVIIGAGIGRLTAAIALKQTGWDVSVYERAWELREVGVGITLDRIIIIVLAAPNNTWETLVKIEATSSRDVLIQCEDLKEAARFYETVLGLRVNHRSETLVGLETGSFCLYLDKGPSYGPVFEFLVPDLAVAKQQLVSAGCRIEVEDPAIPRCYVRDPFGLIFNLAERKQ